MTEYKACSRCKQILPYEAFNKKSSRACGLASGCRECDNAAKRNLSPEQRERKNAKNREYRANNPEVVKVTNHQQYVNKRADRIAYAKKKIADNPERHRKYMAISKRRNHVAVAADSRRRRAKMAENGIYLISKKELTKLLASPCFYCNSLERMTIDHVVAIARGGVDGIGNLLPACKSCNSQKRELTIMEWRLKREGRYPTQ